MSDPAAVAADGAVDPAAAARARALEIANRLSSKLGVPTPDAAAGAETSVLGKRARDEFPTGDGRAVGNRKKKVFVPTEKFPETNWFGIILGPRGTTLKQLEADTGARLFLRGKGASKEGEEEENEDLHVLIMAEEDATLERAGTLIEDYVHNPDKLKALQQQQLAQQAAATPAAGEYAVAAANVTLPASLYSDDANANPSPFAAAGLGLGVPAAVHANTQELKIPHEKVGLVIGRSGETIKSIQAQTGCHIQIAKENECPGPDRTVSLSGDAHQIQLAKDEIMRIITETGRAAAITRGVAFVTPGLGHAAAAGHYGPGSGVYGAVGAVPPVMGIVSSQMNADGSSKTIHIPQIYVGLLIGKAGETIRNIQMKTGTMIQVSHVQKDETSDPAQSTRPVTLIGPPMACAAAEAEINTLIANSQLSGGAPPSVTGAVSGPSTSQVQRIPNAAVGVIIGRAGETIKRIQSVTGTRIQISKDEGKPERDVTITGTAHQIEHAKREIDTVIQGVELREMPPRVGAPRAAAGGFGAAGGYGAPAAAGGYGAAGYGGYGAPAGGYGAPGYGAPAHDPYGYGAPAHDPYGYGAGAHGAHAPYGGYGAAAQPAAAAAPAEAKPAANDQAEYERAYYAHQAAYYAQHGQYDSAPFVWPQK